MRVKTSPLKPPGRWGGASPPVPFWGIVLCGLEGGEGGPGSELSGGLGVGNWPRVEQRPVSSTWRLQST